MTHGTSPASAGPAACDPSKNLDDACHDAEAKISRTDSKASLLLAFVGAVLAGLASLADKKLPLATQITGGTAVLALVAAAVLLLLVVRPNLGGKGRVVQEGFPCWAQLSEDDLLAAMRQDTRVTRAKSLSMVAVAKFRRLTHAVDTILAALALLLLAAGLAVTG
ncbi:Pycsar system effector family protein [Streptomyces diastatochromogenes]|uniref:Pycsar system effector family protein n=1 Tax=Streptomyces diastatochromogenes TaxID=42236 RepID=UPI002F264845